MIVSNISGRRLLPLFKASFAYILDLYSDGPVWSFSKAPSFQVITEVATAPVVHIVNFDTDVSTAVTAAASDLVHRGTTFKVSSVDEGTVAVGRYYYKVVIGSLTYYSPIFTVTCQADVILTYSHTCDTVLTGLSSHVNSVQVKGAKMYSEKVEGTEDAKELNDGGTKVSNVHVRPVYFLEMLCSRDMFERLQYVRHFDSITIRAFDVAYPVKANTFRIESGAPPEGTAKILVSFQLDELDEIVNCHCPVFTADGIEVINGGGTSTDTACPNLIIGIDSSALPALSADITGTPATPRTVKWYKDGVFHSSAESVTIPNENAVWQVRVKVDTCIEKTATYTYVNACNLFTIVETLTGHTLTANYENIPDGQTVTTVVKDSSGTQVSASLPYTPTVSGVYTIEATAGPCVKTKAVAITVASLNCVHTASIEAVGGEFRGVLANEPSGTFTYVWERIDEDNTTGEIATTQNITPTVTGIYIFKATVNRCTAVSEGRLYVAATRVEIVTPVTVITDDRWRYQLFTETTAGFDGTFKTVTITEGTLPDITGLTAQQIQERIQVHLNPNKLNYADPVAYDNDFSISGNTITVHKNLDQWDILTVLFLQDLQ